MTKNKIIIAVDGYSSSGKSTMAKWLARQTGYIYIDTGAMYRAVSLYCLRKGLMNADSIDSEKLEQEISHISIEFKVNEKGENQTFLNGENVENEIRTTRVADGASRVSELKFVRRAMVAQQQKMGREKGIVMDGRDIGTVVFPQAELKLFITASPEIRAKRRFDELAAKGISESYDEVLRGVVERDHRDINRRESPLRKATDAIELDNSLMSIEEQQQWLMNEVLKKSRNSF